MLGYQVVLVQETRAHTATPTAAATFTKLKTQLQDEGWTTFWSNDTSARAGVCIAIDTTLLGSGALTLSGPHRSPRQGTQIAGQVGRT